MYQRIRDLREDEDLTQAEMAQILYCSQEVYSNYELWAEGHSHKGSHQPGEISSYNDGLIFWG